MLLKGWGRKGLAPVGVAWGTLQRNRGSEQGWEWRWVGLRVPVARQGLFLVQKKVGCSPGHTGPLPHAGALSKRSRL